MRLASGPVAVDRPVRLNLGDAVLNGDLRVPPNSQGLVLFAHGSGSSRYSSRNRAVADVLHQARLGTLLLDLLTEDEERTDVVTTTFRFDIPMLGDRVVAAVDWAGRYETTARLALGIFGASTGAAAALIAAARRPRAVRAVVSRGGRPDMAREALREVVAPTLLIVGGSDEVVIELNRQAFDQLSAAKDLRIVPGASHLFEEPGTLGQVAELARDWFTTHL
jgi:dienelactone hydrolase